MGIIVTKTLTFTALFAQGRRIRCEHCGKPFTYVWGGTDAGKTKGLPLLSSDEGLAQIAMGRLLKSLEHIAKAPHMGDGRCPECHYMQKWMVRRRRRGALLCGVFAGAICGPILSLGLVAIGMLTMDKMLASMALTASFVFVVSTPLFLLRAGSAAPKEWKKHPASKTDAELSKWIEECRAKGAEPFLAWYAQVARGPKGKELPVSFGLLNQVGDQFMPEISRGPRLVLPADSG